MKFNVWGTYLISVYADGIEAETEEEARKKLKAMAEQSNSDNVDWVEETNFGCQLPISKEIAQKIPLYDDDTEYGGKSHADEMLDEFMEEIELPFGSPLERINESLKRCGLQTYTVEQIKQLTLTR